jgi:hypothetical protein
VNVVPKRRPSWDGGYPRIATIPTRDEEGMVIECEVTNPPSQKGRTVYLFVPAEDVTDMLLTFRDQTREMRR